MSLYQVSPCLIRVGDDSEFRVTVTAEPLVIPDRPGESTQQCKHHGLKFRFRLAHSAFVRTRPTT